MTQYIESCIDEDGKNYVSFFSDRTWYEVPDLDEFAKKMDAITIPEKLYKAADCDYEIDKYLFWEALNAICNINTASKQ